MKRAVWCYKTQENENRLQHVHCTVQVVIIMATKWNRAGHYIFAMWFLLLLLSFPRLISAVADWMSTILPHIVWP